MSSLPRLFSLSVLALAILSNPVHAANSKTTSKTSASKTSTKTSKNRSKASNTRKATTKTDNATHATVSDVVVADSAVPNAANAQSLALIQRCSKEFDNAVRLACYDRVSANSLAGNAAASGDETKVPLDLAKTLSASLSARRAVPVLAEPNAELTHQDDNVGAIEVKGVAPSKGDKPATPVKITSTDPEAAQQVLDEAGITAIDVERYTPLSVLYDLDKNDPRGIFTIRPHKPMHVLPLWYSVHPNRDPHSPRLDTPEDYPDYQHLDSKVQISLKTKMMEDLFGTQADLWLGYTQKFYWQIYNSKDSRPFKSSDYEPEVFVTQPVLADLPFDGRLRMIGGGFVHHSNGESEPLSRSWNRIYLMGGAEWGKLSVIPRIWAILPDFDKDHIDNKDIGDYMGYGDIRWQYALSNQQSLGGLVRYNPAENKGAIQLDYAYPLRGGVKAYVQLFHGYGERILDYNHKDTNIGIGFMFNDFPGI